jgi:hypothetical protein
VIRRIWVFDSTATLIRPASWPGVWARLRADVTFPVTSSESASAASVSRFVRSVPWIVGL